MDLSELFEALRAPGTPDELAQADTTVSAMVAAHADAAAGVVPLRAVDRRPALVAVGSAVGVLAAVLVTGTAAAAYSGALPENLQRIAHQVIGAPAPVPVEPDESEDGSSSSTGGGASEFTETPGTNGNGPAATLSSKALFGLCTAYADKGTDDQNGDSVAFRVLAEAASANNQTIEEYCAPILASKSPGKPSTPPGQSNKPSTPPGQSNKPTVAPGQSNKPTVAPGSTKTPPGATRKPSVLPTASNNKPSTPPGQTKRPSRSAR
jgi:hypothetical protein